MLGAEVEILHSGERAGVDPAAVEDRLLRDPQQTIKAILVVQVDTASGVWNDIAAIRRAIDSAAHPALLMVDCIASLGCVEYRMDDWRVDVTVGGSQKGLMVPPGLGLVWASEKALVAHQSANMRSPYWDWTKRRSDEAHYLRYCGTAPVQHIRHVGPHKRWSFSSRLVFWYRVNRTRRPRLAIPCFCAGRARSTSAQ